jgi:hypothetical protein
MFFHLFNLAILNSYTLFSSCGGKKISHRDFFNHPSEEHVGSGWTRTKARETHKETTHHFWNIARLIKTSISAGLVHPSWGDVMCALQHV